MQKFRNVGSRTHQSTTAEGGIGTRCLIKYAAGKPVAQVANPITPERPLHAHALEQRIHHEANHSTAKSTRCIDDAICDSALGSEILRRCDGDDHEAETSNAG
jgi:hypothetical protein